ncbi:MAG: carboxymuconolactone decarboxylase family protein [Desulfurivibrionaceae bacterium]|nr:carboxymuconolactone decarboxylase family protein [Desulfurivibrionaceae bacterium]
MECKLLQEEEATGKAAELYDDIRAGFGMVPNFFKAQAAIDPDWAFTNWSRVKRIMLKQGALDRKTKETIAMVVSLMNNCQYCHLAHKTMALMTGATEEELYETIQVMELFQSFTSIAASLEIPCDVTPAMAGK